MNCGVNAVNGWNNISMSEGLPFYTEKGRPSLVHGVHIHQNLSGSGHFLDLWQNMVCYNMVIAREGNMRQVRYLHGGAGLCHVAGSNPACRFFT